MCAKRQTNKIKIYLFCSLMFCAYLNYYFVTFYTDMAPVFRNFKIINTTILLRFRSFKNEIEKSIKLKK